MIRLIFPLLLFVSLSVRGQIDMDSLAQRVNLFGTQLPQEKVFVHLDNTSYFLGDTIRYQAYVTRSDRGTLSGLSGVLYVELLNADGYLVERQIVQLQAGMGDGAFVLSTGRAHYAGYYEIRAYTRWMLNFGRTTLPHNRMSEDWFVRRHIAHEYYVDYDRLYSRTFPVYDAPLAHGEFYPDMTMRPMQRLMGNVKSNDKPVLRLFPEGGNIVAGVPNHLYFEASSAQGRHLRGTVVLTAKDGSELARAETEHRGKGVLTFTPKEGVKYRAQLTCADGSTASITLPAAQSDGVALHAVVTGDSLSLYSLSPNPSPVACARASSEGRGATAGSGQDGLHLTITHAGVVCYYKDLSELPLSKKAPLPSELARAQATGEVLGERLESLPLSSLPKGVLDITVYNGEGRVLADRLVFNHYGVEDNSISVEGLQQQYLPYQSISLCLRRDNMPAPTVVSVSITDADNSDQSTDNGNILTEMLLCSELKGFIEEPGYYFSSFDDEHLHHLDLLMATQGWRRFSWKRQSMPERFTVHHLNETKTPRLTGAVYVYEGIRKADALQDAADAELEQLMRNEEEEFDFNSAYEYSTDKDFALRGIQEEVDRIDLQRQSAVDKGSGRERYQKNPGNLKREVTVHAEFVQPDEEPLFGEVDTDHSMFNIEQPEFYGQFYMHLAAADTTKWQTAKPVKKAQRARHSWVVADEDDYPEFYVRISDPFPRHPKPYNFYRTTLATKQEFSDTLPHSLYDDYTLGEVVVRSKRNGKRRFDASHPALALKAYTAYNMVCDAGLCPGQFVGAERLASDLARMLMGDMGVDREYKLSVRRNGKPASHTMSEAERATFNKLENLDSVFVYTDYAPRLYGNPQWQGDNQPEVVVDIRKPLNDARQMTYRDRFYIRQGFNVCEEFYNPDYSQATPPPIDGKPADLRRTLLWLPATMLKPDGTLDISTFNNGKPTHIRVSVNGIDARGTVLGN